MADKSQELIVNTNSRHEGCISILFNNYGWAKCVHRSYIHLIFLNFSDFVINYLTLLFQHCA